MFIILLILYAIVSCLPLSHSASDCPILLPKNPAASVQDVRVDDIKVISALGDSITAAYAAVGMPKYQVIGLYSLYENRGLSFAIGGDYGAETVGNYFAHFNPSLIGRSIGDRILSLGGIHFSRTDHFNGAITGAKSVDLVSQAEWVINQMNRNPKVNMKNDFKFMTLFIGGNDICASCDHPVNLDVWANGIRRALYLLESKVPRLIVNMLHIFKITEIWNLTENDSFCTRRRSSFLTADCKCAFISGLDGDKNRYSMDELTSQMNARLLDIRNEYVLKNSSTFMVTTDPANANFSLLEAGSNFLSTTDCFHPSQEGHIQFARATWNNLFQPFENKTSVASAQTKFVCPSSSSRIRF